MAPASYPPLIFKHLGSAGQELRLGAWISLEGPSEPCERLLSKLRIVSKGLHGALSSCVDLPGDVGVGASGAQTVASDKQTEAPGDVGTRHGHWRALLKSPVSML